MEAIYKLRDMACDALDEMSKKKNLSASEWGITKELLSSIEKIDNICEREEVGYSQAGEWTANMEGRYGHGNSYGNRGKHFVRSHYSRADGMNSRSDGYSQRRNRNYSRADGKESMIEAAEDLMDEAKTSEERELIRRFISELKSI